jgi:hypothetical protein
MNKLSFFLLLIPVIIFSGCSSVAEKDIPLALKKSHKVTITGTVTYIDRVDVDKSGKNQKFMLHFSLKVESYDDSEGWTMLGSIINCVVKEKTVVEQTGRTLQEGDKVVITANIIDMNPEVIAVQRIKFAGK